MLLKSDWSDLEEDKDTHEQNQEEEMKDWDSNLQKQNKLEEQELHNNKAPQSSPESTSIT